MAEKRTHERLSSVAEDWLVYLALPSHSLAPRAPPYDLAATELPKIFAAAELHGVLPATLGGAGKLLRAAQENQPFLEDARSRLTTYKGLCLLLSHHAGRVMKAFQNAKLDATIIKGPTFARRIYPEPWFRTFTDIDVLVAPNHRARASEIMRALEFALFNIEERAGKDYFEDKWILGSDKKVNVEVHADLVHSPKLRSTMTVGYHDVIAAGSGDPETANALLLVAAAHGAIGHQFDRLQQVVDIAQIAAGAAGPIDVDRLRSVAERCGVISAILASLAIAGRIFPDPACDELARRFGGLRVAHLSSLLLSPRSLIRTHDPNRAFGAWRRKVFRQLLRWASLRNMADRRDN